jgi:formylglycine-generating enzyme required for sulfatase activity
MGRTPPRIETVLLTRPNRPAFTGMMVAFLVALAGCGGIRATIGPAPTASGATPRAPGPAPTPFGSLVPEPSTPAGTTRIDRFGVVQVWVPAGTFEMGSTAAEAAAVAAALPPSWVTRELPSEQPAHRVTLSHGYWIDRDEVKNAAFQAFVDEGGYANRALWSDAGWAWVQRGIPPTTPDQCGEADSQHPRACVNWFEAEAYAAWRGARLPTEAQWEYAARGPGARIYPWGNAWDPTRCNVIDATGTKAIGSYPAGASWVGARDMAGNVMEWTADWFGPTFYATSPEIDPEGPPTGLVKVEKGGWWGANEFAARAAYRASEDQPTYADHHIGLRVVTP